MKCLWCGTETNGVTVTPMGKKTAFIGMNCCGADMEIKWNEKAKKLFGKFLRRNENDSL
jgi:hypothetical protein